MRCFNLNQLIKSKSEKKLRENLMREVSLTTTHHKQKRAKNHCQHEEAKRRSLCREISVWHIFLLWINKKEKENSWKTLSLKCCCEIMRTQSSLPLYAPVGNKYFLYEKQYIDKESKEERQPSPEKCSIIKCEWLETLSALVPLCFVSICVSTFKFKYSKRIISLAFSGIVLV